MNITNNKIAKGGIATLAAGAMALTAAAPAAARDRHDNDGISAGEIIAGAVILGGIAAVASAASKDRGDYRYRTQGGGYYNDGYYNNNRYGYRGNPRSAVEQCVNVARNEARRSGYRYAQVTDIRDVDDKRYGWKVKGKMVVDGSYRNTRYSRYDRYDRRSRWNHHDRDHGKFTCYVERGRVTGLDIDGIRGLR